MKPAQGPLLGGARAHAWQWWRRSSSDGPAGGSRREGTYAWPAHGGVFHLWPSRLWTRAPIQDPALEVAREWILARGGRIVRFEPDLIAARLQDGSHEQYTTSAQRAGQGPDVALLTPGAHDLRTLVTAVTKHATGLTLRLPAGRDTPVALARGAFAPPASGCEACSQGAGKDPARPVCPECPLRRGQYVVVGAPRGPRAAAIEQVREDRSVEYTCAVRAGSPLGRHEELVRLAVDATTGTRLPALPAALLRAATAVPDTATGLPSQEEQQRTLLARAEALLEPSLRAAARLARLQALPTYQRRQADIEQLYSHLLLETPEHASTALAERETALRQLAESLSVEVDVRLVNAATVLSPTACVRVRFAGGGEVAVAVDAGRGTVALPQCVGCGAPWRVGARCAEGHITCLACQEQCAHCGVRRCVRCATPPLAACAICAAQACQRCAQAAVRRGHHHVLARGEQQADPRSASAGAAPAAPEDLTLADLDTMSDATWRACMAWLLAGIGYDVERTIGGNTRDDGEWALVCRRADEPPVDLPLAHLPMAPLVVAVGVRPHCPATLNASDLARARRLAAQVAGATPLLVTTAHLLPQTHLAKENPASVSILARGDLALLLGVGAAPYHRDQAAATATADALAAQAGAVRAALIQGADEAARLLRCEPTSWTHGNADDGQSLASGLVPLTEAAQVARQALAALETLAGAWEALFGADATRDGTLNITTDAALLADLRARADHLLAALSAASAAVGGVAPLGSRVREGWRAAVVEELRLRCLALGARCEAIDPEQWRSFAAAHHQEATARSAQATIASRRAALRAEQFADELKTAMGRTNGRPPTASRRA